MKKVLFLPLLAILTTTAAHAEYRAQVSAFSELQTDGSKLKVSYSLGGGCETHTATLDAELDAKKKNVTFKVFDVTPKYDACESFIYKDASFDLTAELKKIALENNLSKDEMLNLMITLPQIQPTWHNF